MNLSHEIARLSKAKTRLTGLKCVEVIAGESLGTTTIIQLGEITGVQKIGTRRPRQIPIYEASISIQDSTWRLEDRNSVICSSGTDDNSPGSELVLGLKRLVGQRLRTVTFCNTGRDFFLEFDNELSLLVFSVAVRSDATESYSITTTDETITVGFDGQVQIIPQARRTELKLILGEGTGDE